MATFEVCGAELNIGYAIPFRDGVTMVCGLTPDHVGDHVCEYHGFIGDEQHVVIRFKLDERKFPT